MAGPCGPAIGALARDPEAVMTTETALVPTTMPPRNLPARPASGRAAVSGDIDAVG
jgi:hypothetical protein